MTRQMTMSICYISFLVTLFGVYYARGLRLPYYNPSALELWTTYPKEMFISFICPMIGMGVFLTTLMVLLFERWPIDTYRG